MAHHPLLQVQNLRVEFHSGDGRLTVVNNTSFDVMPGEVLAIVGESGSGKSVTAFSILGMVPLLGGEITNGSMVFQGNAGAVDLLGQHPRTLQKMRGAEISMIFQEPMTSLNPSLRCGEQIRETLAAHMHLSSAQAREESIRLIQEVGISDAERAYAAYPHQLSGGQKQRVMIAMAICCKPKLLLADEPTTALDVTIEGKILRVLKDIQQKHQMSLIFISHDLNLVSKIADRVLVMYSGKIVEQGSVETVFNRPQHPYTKGLLACRPSADRKLYFLPTVDDFMRFSAEGDGYETELSVESVLKNLEIKSAAHRPGQLATDEYQLEVQNLSKQYIKYPFNPFRSPQVVQAVNDISFKVRKGETLGIVGESGSGKSTLARCISSLLDADGGDVVFEGIPVIKNGRKLFSTGLHDIQYIFQDPYSSLNPKMAIGDALLEPLEVMQKFGSHAARMERVKEMLVQVGLKPYHASHYPHEFSGGQRQRICFARALILEPKLIICDEAVSALDMSVQAQVLNLLNELKFQYKFTYLFISHDLNVVKFMSDRVMVMKDGALIEIGDAEELYNNPRAAYTKELIAAVKKAG